MDKNDLVIKQLVKCATANLTELKELAGNLSGYIVNNLYKFTRPLNPMAINYNLHATYNFTKSVEVSEFCGALAELGVLVAIPSGEFIHYGISYDFRKLVEYEIAPILEISIRIKGVEINGRALRGIVRICRNHLDIADAVPEMIIPEMAIGDRIYNADEMKSIIEYVEDKEMFYDKPE
jgi:hypothetical protein